MLMTITEYARHRGCDLKAVQYAVSRGRITRDQRGFIESDQADQDWEDRTDHSKARYGLKRVSSRPISSTHSRRDQPFNSEARKELDQPFDGSFSSPPNFAAARAVKEICEAKLRRMDLEERRGNLLPRGAVEKAAFNSFRVLREAILNVPCRVSGQLAAESDPRKVQDLLENEIKQALESFAGLERNEPIETSDDSGSGTDGPADYSLRSDASSTIIA
jgi:hypothetical protein